MNEISPRTPIVPYYSRVPNTTGECIFFEKKKEMDEGFFCLLGEILV